MSAPTQNKGYDDSQPRNGTIAFYAVLTVFTLIGVKFMLDSYFEHTMETEYYDKVLSRGMEEVKAVREREQADLDKAGLGAAMKAIAQRGRAASPSIAPETGAGKPEVSGWSKLGRVVPGATAADQAAVDNAAGDTPSPVVPTPADASKPGQVAPAPSPVLPAHNNAAAATPAAH